MRKYALFSFLPVILVIACLQASNVYATTCTQSGDTTYCTDTSTGQTTTYNQYGDNIYGSDGSSWTIYNSPFSGGGSGYSVPSLSGVDTDSPEYKAALARHKEACANNKGASGEVIIGGTQAAECREAYIAWLDVLNNSRTSNQSDSGDEYYDYSDDDDEDLDEWTKKLLSDYGITNGSSQPENWCVSRGLPNTHPEGEKCFCDIGYLQAGNQCVLLTFESCEAVKGKGAVPLEGTNMCRCGVGYSPNSSNSGCVPVSAATNGSESKPSSLEQSDGIAGNTLSKFETKSEDTLPSHITSKFSNNPKFRLLMTPAPIRMTRAEYEAKYGVPPPTNPVVETEKEAGFFSWWKKILSWFGF